jgi:hypothetical protein
MSTKTSQPVQDATGYARWISYEPAISLGMGSTAALLIASETKGGPVIAGYVVHPIRDGERTVGYRLDNANNGKSYDLPADLSSCECNDHLKRGRACKHMRGLRVALSRINLL